MKYRFLLLNIAIIIILSCNDDTQEQKLALDQISEDSVGLVQLSIDSIFSDNNPKSFPITADAESQRSAWMSIFKSCYESNLIDKSLFNTSLLYLGPSSNMYLGTVVDKKFISNNFDVKTELKYLIPLSEFSKFSTIGTSVNNCDLTKVDTKQISLDLFLSGVIAQGMNDSLGLMLSHWDSLKIISGRWQVDYIRESDFLHYLDKNMTNPDIKYYRDVVFNNRNRLITKVIKVTGFKADAYYNDTFAAKLKAGLSNPISLKIVGDSQEVAKSDSLSATLNFSKSSSKEVHISSNNSFYIFGNIRLARRL